MTSIYRLTELTKQIERDELIRVMRKYGKKTQNEEWVFSFDKEEYPPIVSAYPYDIVDNFYVFKVILRGDYLYFLIRSTDCIDEDELSFDKFDIEPGHTNFITEELLGIVGGTHSDEYEEDFYNRIKGFLTTFNK